MLSASRPYTVAEVFRFHADGGDVVNVTEGAAEWMDDVDAGYLTERDVRLVTIDEVQSGR